MRTTSICSLQVCEQLTSQLLISCRRFAGGAGKTLKLAQALPKRFSSGMLKCPDNARVCGSAADSCGSCIHGYCQAGRCHCALDWLGDACDVHVSSVPDMDAWFLQHGGNIAAQRSSSNGGTSSSINSGVGAGSPLPQSPQPQQQQQQLQLQLPALPPVEDPQQGGVTALAGTGSSSGASGGVLQVLPVSSGLEWMPAKVAVAGATRSTTPASSKSSAAPVSTKAQAVDAMKLASSSSTSTASSSVSSLSTTVGGSSKNVQPAAHVDATSALLFAQMLQLEVPAGSRLPGTSSSSNTVATTVKASPTAVKATAGSPAAASALDTLLASLTLPSPVAAPPAAPAPALPPSLQQRQQQLLQQLMLGGGAGSAAAPAAAAQPQQQSQAQAKKPAVPAPPPSKAAGAGNMWVSAGVVGFG